VEDAPGDRKAAFVLGPELCERLQLVVAEERVRHVQLGLDVGVGARRPDEPCIGLGAEQQAERLREDRLAGARLAGDHVEAGRERELGVPDQHEVVDPQPRQHRP